MNQDVKLKQISEIQPLYYIHVLQTPVLLLLQLQHLRRFAQMKNIVCVHVKWLNM